MSTKTLCDGCGKNISTPYGLIDRFQVTHAGTGFTLMVDTSPKDYCVECMNLMTHLLKQHLREQGKPTYPEMVRPLPSSQDDPPLF